MPVIGTQSTKKKIKKKFDFTTSIEVQRVSLTFVPSDKICEFQPWLQISSSNHMALLGKFTPAAAKAIKAKYLQWIKF